MKLFKVYGCKGGMSKILAFDKYSAMDVYCQKQGWADYAEYYSVGGNLIVREA